MSLRERLLVCVALCAVVCVVWWTHGADLYTSAPRAPLVVHPDTLSLAIVIPTAPRGVDYLPRVAASMERELGRVARAFSGRLTIVWHRAVSNHGALDALLESSGRYLRVCNVSVVVGPRVPVPDDDPANDVAGSDPGYRARRFTRDYVAALRAGAATGARYVMTIEDDYVWCPGILDAVFVLLGEATRRARPWGALHTMYATSGVLVPADDVASLSDYVLSRVALLPADWALYEWGESRGSYAARQHLGEHIGISSTISAEKRTHHWPCGAPRDGTAATCHLLTPC